MGNILFHLQFPPPEPFAGVQIASLFESLDQWTKQTGGTGAYTINENYLELRTGTTINGIARVWKAPSLPPMIPSWSKARRFKFYLESSINTDENSENYVCTGMGLPSDRGFGFKFLGDKIQGFSANGPGPSFVDLITGLTPGAWQYHLYEGRLIPGSKVEFYIDGVKIDELTTDVPTGVSNAHIPIRFAVKNQANIQHLIRCSGCIFSQEE